MSTPTIPVAGEDGSAASRARDAAEGAAAALEYARRRHGVFVADLLEWLRIPSVSTDPARAADCAAAARWAASRLTAWGVAAEVVEPAPGGHPLVVAARDEDPALPTVLLYGHYDVQSPEPLGDWTSVPFVPAVRGDDVFARGASDNKGQCWALLCAVHAWIASVGRLPVNLRVVVEGEEESGGRTLTDFVGTHAERLRADAAWVADASLFAPGMPALYSAVRGILYLELEAQGARADLHSGMYGGVAPNPLLAICHVLAACKPWNGAVNLPGFYERVRRPSAEELAGWAALPFDEPTFRLEQVQAEALPGEHGFTVLERLWTRPTFDVHGIVGGFVADGAKTVIPARATAKVSMRLVPDQDPDAVLHSFEDRINFLRPEGVTFTIRVLESAPPLQLPLGHPVVAAGKRALVAAFGREPVVVRSGVSLPALNLIAHRLRVPTVMTGFGLPDDRPHAPDEKFHLPNLQAGIAATIAFLRECGALPRT